MTDRKGFMDITLAIALVVILLVGGFVFWRINQADNTADSSNNTVNTNPADSDNDESEETAGEEPDEEADDGLKTYTNETYGFSLEYPDSSDWILDASDGEVEEDQSIVSIKYDCGPNCGLAFNMNLDAVDPMTAQDWKDQFAQNSVYELAGEEDVSFGSVTGTKLTFSPDGVEQVDDIVHVVANQVSGTIQIMVNLNGSTTDAIDITDEGLKILNSLKFN